MSNRIIKKVSIILIIIILVTCINPIVQSNAISVESVLMKPLTQLVIWIIDAVNSLITLMLQGETAYENLTAAMSSNENLGEAVAGAFVDPSTIFRGEVEVLNANIFKVETSTATDFGNSPSDLMKIVKESIAGIYEIIRNLAAVILLALLIYTGIRIVLSSNSAEEKAKWKMILFDWIKALALVIFIHVLMITIFTVSELIMDILLNSLLKDNNNYLFTIRSEYNNLSWDGKALQYLVITFMYGYITYLTIIFAIAYFKRLFFTLVFIVIAPIIAVTYALGGDRKQIFGNWFKNFTMNVLVQPYQLLIYTILIGIPLNLIGGVGGGNFFAEIFAIIALSMIRPAQKMLDDLLGMEKGIAATASFDSGHAPIDKMKKFGKAALEVGAGILSGNLGLAAKGASGLMVEDDPNQPQQGENPINNVEEDIIEEDTPINQNGNSRQGSTNRNQVNNLVDDGLENGDVSSENQEEQKPSLTDRLANSILYGDPRNLSGMAKNGIHKIGEKIEEKAEGTRAGKIIDKGKQVAAAPKKLADKIANSSVGKIPVAGIKRMGAGIRYLKSDEGKEKLIAAGKALDELHSTMYLPGHAPRDGGGFLNSAGEHLKASGEAKISQFIENKNNIEYIKQVHGYKDDKIKGTADAQAKARLESASKFLKYGVNNVAVADRLVDYKKENGLTVEQAVLQYGRSEENRQALREQASVKAFVNDEVQMNVMANIVASKLGIQPAERSKPENVKIIQKETIKEVQKGAPYIAAGVATTADDINRMNKLASEIAKNVKLGKNANVPQITIKAEKIVNKAIKDGMDRVDLPNSDRKESVRQLEEICNRQLGERRNN